MGNLSNTQAYDANMSENDFELLPAGDYTAMIVNSESKTSQAGHNMLSLSWEILEGVLKGRIIFENLNLEHPKENVRQISAKALNAILGATGKHNAGDSAELHGIPCFIRVGITKDGQYNNIKKHGSLSEQTSAPLPQAQPAPQQQGDKPSFMK